MAYRLSNSDVTDDVTWPPKVLWSSTVGYPSDSLASCILNRQCNVPLTRGPSVIAEPNTVVARTKKIWRHQTW